MLAACGLAAPQGSMTPEQRAVAFLASEVPKWAKENKCYSCHNNGDAARALFAAAQAGLLADRAPLADTLAFLAVPKRWDDNGPEGPFQDKKLARIQFAAALAEAANAGLTADRDARAIAARLVAELQSDDGSWETEVAGNVGSPVTYGQTLATWMSILALAGDGEAKHRAALAKARAWFEATEPRTVLDAAATLLALADRASEAAEKRREGALELARRGQGEDGGWGPLVNSPSEVFDTALVVLALAAQKDQAKVRALAEKGRAFLLARQSEDGSWPATTRPPGVDSYAQRVSTSAWATLALIATRPPRECD
jgi:hypothetical protein